MSIQVCVLNVCPGVSPGTNRIGSCAFGNVAVLHGFRRLKRSELVLCSGFVTARLSSQSRGAQKSLGYCPVVYRATRSGCIHSVDHGVQCIASRMGKRQLGTGYLNAREQFWGLLSFLNSGQNPSPRYWVLFQQENHLLATADPDPVVLGTFLF